MSAAFLGWTTSAPRIFMGKGNFLTELDLWGSAEVQLIIPAGVWRWQLASSDAEQLKKRAMARDGFGVGNSSASCLITQCFVAYSTCYHTQEEIAILLEIVSGKCCMRNVGAVHYVWITELFCCLQGQKCVNNYARLRAWLRALDLRFATIQLLEKSAFFLNTFIGTLN